MSGRDESAVGAAARALWAFRVELALLGALAAAGRAAGERWGSPWHVIMPVLLAGVTAVLPRLRRPILRMLGRSRVRRCWHRSVRRVGIRAFGDQLPLVSRLREAPAGYRLEIRVPPGGCVDDLASVAERIASMLRVREVRIRRHDDDASRAEVVIVRRDPLASTEPLPWPLAAAPSNSLWDPIPVGIDEDGQVVGLSLPEHNLLLGGEPGAGKSVSLSLLTAAAALDPAVKLWLLDGKLVELAPWSGCAERSVGANLAEAIEVLKVIQGEMERRYEQLLRDRRRKVGADDGLPLHVVVCDELAMYLTVGDRKERGEFADLLRDLVARGRAAGVIVLAATQKPASDVVPTSLRDLFGFRWAMRCATREASDTILGSGWATLGCSASEVDAAARGVGFLLHEGGQPVRLRSYCLDDEGILGLAERAEALRQCHSAAGGST